MWSQYSWGNLTTIQMAAAALTTVVAASLGSRRSRSSSYQMKKYSKVLGSRKRRMRQSSHSNRATPASRR